MYQNQEAYMLWLRFTKISFSSLLVPHHASFLNNVSKIVKANFSFMNLLVLIF